MEEVKEIVQVHSYMTDMIVICFSILTLVACQMSKDESPVDTFLASLEMLQNYGLATSRMHFYSSWWLISSSALRNPGVLLASVC